jgi:hypothetical protein
MESANDRMIWGDINRRLQESKNGLDERATEIGEINRMSCASMNDVAKSAIGQKELGAR